MRPTEWRRSSRSARSDTRGKRLPRVSDLADLDERRHSVGRMDHRYRAGNTGIVLALPWAQRPGRLRENVAHERVRLDGRRLDVLRFHRAVHAQLAGWAWGA